tara:strand:+ start:816 stop:1136 length:321 start_codon:yes stop_codon:yes gene_type:complete
MAKVRLVDELLNSPRRAKETGWPDVLKMYEVTVPVFVYEDGTKADTIGVNHHEYVDPDREEWEIIALKSLEQESLWDHEVPKDVAETAIEAVKARLKRLETQKGGE